MIFTGISCEEEFIVKMPDYQERIVLNSIFSSDSSWVVNLSTTKNAFDPESTFNEIDDAEVEIFDVMGNKLCSLYNQGKGNYTNINFYPVDNQLYTVKVHHSVLGDVEASSMTPSKPDVENVEWVEGTIENSRNISFELINNEYSDEVYIWDIVTINESTNVTSNYAIPNILIPEKNKNTFNFTVNSGASIITDPRVLTESKENLGKNIVNISYNQSNDDDAIMVIFSNDSSGGNSGEGNGDGGNNGGDDDHNGSNGNNSGKDLTNAKKYVRLMTVSNELYQYFVSLENYYKNQYVGSSINSQNEIYSNVNNGFGIFGAYTTLLIPIE
ncbi:MAG TPA: DUF4249 family protein [Saprospiraceae bacterium]|nr:DUF4249 family protein [Saprospiraceae bacterium]MCB9328199.1 DUF4249 family protein [Lewinellaceae bacterium]HPQ20412.1 DUF4249 family protein [Saprospiraceae bacterium]HRX29232.1 DUF4249 family protein [Saprospiraceae bacterium]